MIDFQAGYVDYLAQCFYSFTQPFIGKRSLSKLKSFVDSLNQSQNISWFLQDFYFVSFVRKFKMKLFELTKNHITLLYLTNKQIKMIRYSILCLFGDPLKYLWYINIFPK